MPELWAAKGGISTSIDLGNIYFLFYQIQLLFTVCQQFKSEKCGETGKGGKGPRLDLSLSCCVRLVFESHRMGGCGGPERSRHCNFMQMQINKT